MTGQRFEKKAEKKMRINGANLNLSTWIFEFKMRLPEVLEI